MANVVWKLTDKILPFLSLLLQYIWYIGTKTIHGQRQKKSIFLKKLGVYLNYKEFVIYYDTIV